MQDELFSDVDIQEAINKIILTITRHKVRVKSNTKLNILMHQIMGAMTYVNGIKILIKKTEFNQLPQYDSVLPLCRAFLEMYARICYMIVKYPNSSEYDDYYKKLVVEDIVQNKMWYGSIEYDKTITNEIERSESLKILIEALEKNIIQFFPQEEANIKDNDKKGSIFQIIKKLSAAYENKYEPNKSKRIGINDFIGNALKNNIAYKNEFGFEYRDAFSVYRVLCSESHSNVARTNWRTTHNGCFSINMNNQRNGEAAISTVIWCVKDIEYKFNLLCD